MNIQDTLDREQESYNLSAHYQNNNPKWAMQNLYKHQLDSLLNQKNKQKEINRERQVRQRQDFNDRANTNKESEKIKDQAYKNYYNMLLNNQEQLQSSYVSPFSVRDTMKDQHITHSVEEGEQRMKQWEMDERRRQLEKKNMYRSELMHQIEERRNLNSRHRQEQTKQKEEYRKYGKLPDQINKYERQRHLEEMAKYKEDLDKVKVEKDYFKTRSMSDQQNLKLPNEHHNTIINPLPYNIQNPYILREMNRQNQGPRQNNIFPS